jgi:hypothetical protein
VSIIKILSEEEGTKSINDWLQFKMKDFHESKYGEKCVVIHNEIHNVKTA